MAIITIRQHRRRGAHACNENLPPCRALRDTLAGLRCGIGGPCHVCILPYFRVGVEKSIALCLQGGVNGQRTLADVAAVSSRTIHAMRKDTIRVWRSGGMVVPFGTFHHLARQLRQQQAQACCALNTGCPRIGVCLPSFGGFAGARRVRTKSSQCLRIVSSPFSAIYFLSATESRNRLRNLDLASRAKPFRNAAVPCSAFAAAGVIAGDVVLARIEIALAAYCVNYTISALPCSTAYPPTTEWRSRRAVATGAQKCHTPYVPYIIYSESLYRRVKPSPPLAGACAINLRARLRRRWSRSGRGSRGARPPCPRGRTR